MFPSTCVPLVPIKSGSVLAEDVNSTIICTDSVSDKACSVLLSEKLAIDLLMGLLRGVPENSPLSSRLTCQPAPWP